MKRATQLATLSAAALLTIAVAGCSDDSSSGPKPSGGDAPGSTQPSAPSGASSSKNSSGVDDAIAKVMGSKSDLPAIASSKGTLKGSSETSSVEAEVLQVSSSPQATRVTWRLKSASAKTADSKSFQFARPPLFDTRLLGVVDPKTRKTFHPYTFVPMSRDDGQDNACACSSLPDSINAEGVVLYAVLPPLPAGTSSVNVTLPGFKPMTGVKVSS